MIDAFIDAARDDAATYPASAWESLLPMAVIQAACLSDQTNQPELPDRLLRSYDVTPDDCRRAVPDEKD